VDPNVHPSSTLKLVQALIEANKDFELLILPNQIHNLGTRRYLIRRRWDFFVRHLLQVEPPAPRCPEPASGMKADQDRSRANCLLRV